MRNLITRNYGRMSPPYGTKPQGPLARGLVDCYLFNSNQWWSTAGTESSMVNGGYGSYTVAAVSRATRQGVGPYFDGSTGPLNTNRGYTSTNGTIALLYHQISSSGSDCFATQNSSSDGFIGLGFQGQTFYVSNSLLSFTTSPVNNRTYLIVGVWGGAGMSYYRISTESGIEKLTNADTTVPVLRTGYSMQWGAFKYSGGVVFRATMVPLLGLVYDRNLTYSEILDLWNEPFAMFAPVSIPLINTAAAPVSGGINPLSGMIHSRDAGMMPAKNMIVARC